MAQLAHDFKEKTRTGDVLISENIDFSGLLLSEPVLRGLQNAGFVRPSPIQLKAIPLGRCGLDLIVQAKSGTGKTCVFSVVALESITTDTASTQVLVLAPTREIAVQIWEVINSIGSAIYGLECHTFIGGLPVPEDRMKLRKCHIAVGSPGRIKQLIEGGALKTDSIRLFVLDEADKLLEESFQEQINWIYSTLPDNKQMLALSATYPESLATHLTSYMRNPTYLRLNITDPALLGIRQYFKTVPYHPMAQAVYENKSKALVTILSSVSFQQCLVFSNLQTRAQTLADSLISQGWPTACIAGCLDQKDRNEAMAKLKTYKCRILISTDLTSRGIDADKVSLVINLDVPKDHETYLHRIGRAGRFGAFGIGITLVSEGQEKLSLDAIEKRCNTHILALPDPLPSDLAKAEAPVFLDDVVSTELIRTDSGSNNAIDSINATDSLVEKIKEVDSQDIGDLEKAEKAALKKNEETLIPVEPSDSDTEDDSASAQNGPSKTCEETLADKVKYEKMMTALDKSFELHSTEEVVMPEREVVTKAFVEQCQIECPIRNCEVETSDAREDIASHVTKNMLNSSVLDKMTETKETGLKHVEQLQDAQDSCYTTTQAACQVEDKKQCVESGKQTNEKAADLAETEVVILNADEIKARATVILENMNVSEIFRHSIGYTPLEKSYTYNTCCTALREFGKEKNGRSDGLKDNFQCFRDSSEDSLRLKAAVDSLQELFDSSIITLSNIVQNADDVGEEVRPEMGQNGANFKASELEDREGKQKRVQDQVPSQHENFPHTSCAGFDNYNQCFVQKQNGDVKSMSMYNGEQEHISENGEADANIKNTEEKRSRVVDERVNKKRHQEDTAGYKSKPKNQQSRIGYRGKFSIGHFLEIEREKDSNEMEVVDSKKFCDQSKAPVRAVGQVFIEKMEENEIQKQWYEEKSNRIGENKLGSIGIETDNNLRKHSCEKVQTTREKETSSDYTESEHSKSEFTEDSDTDSDSSEIFQETRTRYQAQKHLYSKDKRNRQTSKKKFREVPQSITNGIEYEHNPFRYDIPNRYGMNHNHSPSHYAYNPHYAQQHSWQWPSYFPDYCLPPQHTNQYHGHPYQFYYPYHFNAVSAMPRQYDWNASLETARQMQEEYIKIMCKMEDR